MGHNFEHLSVNCTEMSEIELQCSYIVMEDEWLSYFNNMCSHFIKCVPAQRNKRK